MPEALARPDPAHLAASSSAVPTDAAEIERLRASLRDALVAAEAARALNAEGVTRTGAALLQSVVASQLGAMDLGEPDCFVRVLGVDAAGRVRPGPRGSLTPDDLVVELRAAHPEWRGLFASRSSNYVR